MAKYLTKAAILAALLLQTTQLFAKPVIFIPESEGFAWWAREIVIRPMAKSVQGVTVESINAWLTAKAGMRSPEMLCYLEGLSDDSIVSSKRETQIEIERTLAENPNSFHQIYINRTGEKFHVRVAAFETCGSMPRSRTGLIITNEKEILVSFVESEFYFTRLLLRQDGKINVFACFSCGDVSELNFNPEGPDFYLRWIGH